MEQLVRRLRDTCVTMGTVRAVGQEAMRLKKKGFQAAGVPESAGDMALKAGGGLFVAMNVAMRVKKTVVGTAAGALPPPR